MSNQQKRNRKSKLTIDSEIDLKFDGKLPPHSRELESAILGAVLLEPYALDQLAVNLNHEHFYYNEHQKIAKAITELYSENKPVDILTVTTRLKEKKELEEVGGPYYVSSLTNRIASSANIEHHLRIVQQHFLLRRLMTICSSTISKCFDDGTDVFDLYENVQNELEEAIKEVISYDVEKVGSIHDKNIVELIDVLKNGKSSGVPSGLRAVDNLTNGWQKTDFIVLAGRPSMGKTAAAISMLVYPAIMKLEPDPVAIFSLEMSKGQLVGRIQSQIAEIDVSRIVKKNIDETELQRLIALGDMLHKAPIFIDDTPMLSLVELKAKSRRLVREEGVKLIVIDYLQLMSSGLYIGNREQEIAHISRGIKALAKELDVPIIALSQLSRTVESRGDKKPMLSDLRESGQIEQDADMVIFCYRPEYYGIETYEVGSETFNANGLFMFLVEKHRNGSIGEIPLAFVNMFARVRNYGFVQEEERRESSYVSPVTPSIKPNDDFQKKEESNTVWPKDDNNDDIPF